MKKKQVISWKNIRTRCPIEFTLLVMLCIKTFEFHGWPIGVLWTVTVLVWLGWIISIFTEEDKDIFI
jgi:hypothetical protein